MDFPLTATDFRGFETTALGDVPLQALLDAAAAEIVRYAGASGSTVEWFSGGQRYIVLSRPAASVASIVETTIWDGVGITLATNDYLAHPGGYILERVGTGTNGRWSWWGRVAVTYTPADDEALRIGVQVDLMKLALSYTPGTTSERIGDWTETFNTAMAANQGERDEILRRLLMRGSMLVVGG